MNNENNLVQTSNEANLKKVIGFWDAMFYALGLCIGGGVMALTGIGIGMTGASIPLAYIVAAVIVLCLSIPLVILGSALPTTAGLYRYITRLVSPKLAVFYLFAVVIGQITIATFGLSFADYFLGIFPGASPKIVALLFMCSMYVISMFGMKTISKFQNIFVLALVSTIMLFIVYGIPQINTDILKENNFFMNGPTQFLSASALMVFAMFGATGITDLGGEMINPKKHIPRVIIYSTFICAALFTLLSIVAVGVLPFDKVAFQPLINVAQSIFPRTLYIVFVVFGAFLALATTLIGYYGWVPKAFIIAADDGLIPSWIGTVNKKTGAPVVLNTIIFLVGTIPIILDLPLEFVGRIGPGILMFTDVFAILALFNLPKLEPEAFNNSMFKMSTKKLYTIATIVLCVCIMHAFYNFVGYDPLTYIVMGSYIVIALVVSIIRSKRFNPKNKF